MSKAGAINSEIGRRVGLGCSLLSVVHLLTLRSRRRAREPVRKPRSRSSQGLRTNRAKVPIGAYLDPSRLLKKGLRAFIHA
jgi:hypothetical protein